MRATASCGRPSSTRVAATAHSGMRVGGLSAVSGYRIWVARRTATGEQILSVDWDAITRHGVTTTNYPLQSGDRVHAAATR